MKATILLLLAPLVCLGANCSRTFTGFPAFDDPYPQLYRGMATGLYPNGLPFRPAAHEALGMKQAAAVVPRARDGSPDAQNGRIVLLSIGMSNTTAEFSAFMQVASRDPLRNPRVTLVDGAIGGASADFIVANPNQYWLGQDGRSGVMGRLTTAGVTAEQVQAVWLKQADAGPTLAFPSDARKLQSELETIILDMLVPRFPNLKLVYLSNRIYAGYANSTLNPEPYSYQTGFAVKWLIESQINGDAKWNVDGGKAPWIAWGPNLWADGTARRFDGLSWACSELADDGTHPSAAGQQKVAGMLQDFFRTDSTARAWYLASGAAPAVPAAGAIVNAAGYGNTIAAGSIVTIFGTGLAGGTQQAGSLPLPHVLGDTRVEIDGQPALLYFVSPGQINFVMPWTGGTSLRVVRGATASAASAMPLTLRSPGIFTADSRPGGPAAVLHADWTPVSSASPARAGETLQMFGTGMGMVNPLLAIATPLPQVLVAGASAEVKYAGPAPGWPGMDQINFVVPLGVAGTATVEFRYGSASNQATLEVAAR